MNTSPKSLDDNSGFQSNSPATAWNVSLEWQRDEPWLNFFCFRCASGILANGAEHFNHFCWSTVCHCRMKSWPERWGSLLTKCMRGGDTMLWRIAKEAWGLHNTPLFHFRLIPHDQTATSLVFWRSQYLREDPPIGWSGWYRSGNVPLPQRSRGKPLWARVS